jgi:hypothetical protein
LSLLSHESISLVFVINILLYNIGFSLMCKFLHVKKLVSLY